MQAVKVGNRRLNTELSPALLIRDKQDSCWGGQTWDKIGKHLVAPGLL